MLLLKTERDRLLRPLQAVSGIVDKRHTLPILSNVLLERTDGRLTLLATDIELQIQTIAEQTDASEPVALTVSARKFQDILRALPEGEVALQAEDKRLLIRSGKSRFTLQTLPAADYPRMSASTEVAVTVSMAQRHLRRLIGLVQYAMALQDIRYYLNGMLMVVRAGEFRLVATDGHRLAYASMPLPGVSEEIEIILPRKAVLELARLLADNDDPVQLRLGATQAQFNFGSIEFITKLIDGKFPDYDRVIPVGHDRVFALARTTLQAALLRAAILTNERFRGVRMVLSAGTLKLVSSNAEQEEAEELIDVDYHWEPMDIGFNVNYLIDMLSNVAIETVEVSLKDSGSSALFSFPGQDDFKYVVMPMRI